MSDESHLLQLAHLAAAGRLDPNDLLWRPGMQVAVPARQLEPFRGYFRGSALGDDAAVRWPLPVGRSPWAIAAGYLGLFSVLLVFGPFAVLTGLLGLRQIDRTPGLHGWGKLARIRDIRAAGLEHEIWIVRYGMTSAEYTAVEAAVIDVLGSFPIARARRGLRYRPIERRDELTNRRREDARGKGMELLDRLVDEFAAPPLTTAEPLLLITLRPWEDLDEVIAGGRARPGNGFKREWLDPVLRERDVRLLEMATSSRWVISPRQVQRRGIRYAVPVFRGVTRGLLDVKPGSWERLTPKRWGFVATPVLSGPVFDDVVGPYGHRVPGRERGAQNPVAYWPRLSAGR